MQKPVILVVDDNQMLREAIRYRLTKRHFEVLEAKSGNEALGMVKSHAQRNMIVLSDIRMEDGTGLELLANLRRVNYTKPIVFLMTAHSDITHEQAIAKGAAGFFYKPFDVHNFLEQMEAAVKLHPDLTEDV